MIFYAAVLGVFVGTIMMSRGFIRLSGFDKVDFSIYTVSGWVIVYFANLIGWQAFVLVTAMYMGLYFAWGHKLDES